MKLRAGFPLCALPVFLLPNLAEATDAPAPAAPTPVEDVKSVPELLIDAVTGGKVDLSFRYRFGLIDEDGLARNAKASTLRTMLGYHTKPFYFTSGYIQVRNVTTIGAEKFNDTLNGKTSYPVEPDPEASEVDQAFVKFEGLAGTAITGGRRKLKLGNERFISDLGWRQNNRSFDGIVVENTSVPDTTLFYSYAFNINRAFTDKSPNGNFDEGTKVHLFNAAYSGLPMLGRIELYGYLLDLDGIVAPNPASLSTATFGGNITGKQKLSDGVTLLYTAEFAHQVDYKDNPRDIALNYYRIEPGIAFAGLTVKAGLEVFESDGVVSFAAPLGLLHAFGGWADKFLPAPGRGLEDFYISANYVVKGTGTPIDGLRLIAAYHDFNPQSGGGDYGTEWDFGIVKKFHDHYTVALHYADYNADNFSTDTRKLWLTLNASF